MDGLLEANHNQDVGQGEEGFGTAVEPIDIGQLRIVLRFGIDSGGNRDEHEDEEKIEPTEREFGGLRGFSEKPEEAEVGEQGEGEEGFFGHDFWGLFRCDVLGVSLRFGIAPDPPGGSHHGAVAD